MKKREKFEKCDECNKQIYENDEFIEITKSIGKLVVLLKLNMRLK